MDTIPVATYRLQLRPEFTLDDAAAQVPYLARLGISHVYLSPCLQATPGSTHGYDVVDPSRVNAELGGEPARQRLCQALEAHGMGQVLDIVPNHMAVAGDQNPWWWDVLENGPASRYAPYFDVDWEASEERWPNKVLLPVLGDHYGRILENGELKVRFHEGHFTLRYHEHSFPLDPWSLAGILGGAHQDSGSELLGFLAESCARLPRPGSTTGGQRERRHRDKAVIHQLLAGTCRDEPHAQAAILARVERINQDPDALDALIEHQNYRLAWWRTADRDLGYRRFFDIKDLAGLRVEDQEVFEAIHQLPLSWYQEGSVQGLRIDHPDGLRDPAQYFQRLAQACPGAWVVAEKILEPGEHIPEDWPIAGTTGYDFLNRVQGLFVDPDGEAPLTTLWEALTGETAPLEDQVYQAKRQVLQDLLGSELNRLTSLFVSICEGQRRHRDYTRHQLQQVLLEAASCFPVYRSYLRAGEPVHPTDRAHIHQALSRVKARRPDLDPELLAFLETLLTLAREGHRETELALRFQQLTGPAMAKGVEDTVFYRYHRLIALNEVGGDPGQFGLSPEDFHGACAEAHRRHPQAMLATSTHDTKRSEDVRARLCLLSQVPEAWAEAVRGLWAHNARHRSPQGPDPAVEYLYYQALVGVWPGVADEEVVKGLLPRLQGFMEKAAREAKVHTSWTRNNPEYEQAVQHFVEATLGDDTFLQQLQAFAAPLIEPGRVNSLAQTLIKLTTPGVPDIYQGTELWDLSLVDPDNRRPVDFAERQAWLEVCKAGPAPERILEDMEAGLPKLWVIHRTLALRGQHPHWFDERAGYHPLQATGDPRQAAVAYRRGPDPGEGGQAEGVVVIVPRLTLRLGGDWSDTRLTLPRGRWYHWLTGDTLEGGEHPVADLLARFPVALLASAPPPAPEQNRDSS
ncbi:MULTISPECIES: malto-oligosyltrehalose synthase [unclassified Ectothiorhodospira]|uniref:malto-oligosyltrehalose synthase n=1 Tax=unclassified Ectothiorhodospira TaxID=2684909 RepID=UPI001EE87074|nr:MULTISPECIES: malto-oligosyltrehalose synthase [unclassified Ectothiorhodospira]MCG5516604.1 malto-oligosyltrehalose synthase [Ectothiorhodospira sp. 9100]MCG5520306.1 malto-oligosyltrehalose synthase [Ectothiorhodospira sp. 9905]